MQKQTVLMDLVFVSDPGLLCVVRAAIERLTEVYGFSPPECRAITRAVDEALANVIRHAYNNQPGQRIEVSCKRITGSFEGTEHEALEIDLLDWGIPLDPTKLTARSLDEVRPGGLGLHFIRDGMDIVERHTLDGANQLRLIKYFAASKASTVTDSTHRSQGE